MNFTLDSTTIVLGALNIVSWGLLALLRFFGTRLQTKVDELSSSTAKLAASAITSEELTQLEERADIRRDKVAEDTAKRLGRIEEKLDAAARVEVRLEAALVEIKSWGEWRHRVVEPHVNAQLEMKGYVTALRERVDRLESAIMSYPRNRRSNDT